MEKRGLFDEISWPDKMEGDAPESIRKMDEMMKAG